MSMDYDIALSEVDAATEPDKLVGLITTWYDQNSMSKMARAVVWQQNIHFLAGDQWLRWNTANNRWAAMPLTNVNQMIDRPVSNYILVYTNANASGFTGKPQLSIDPNSDDPRDKTAANVANVVMDYLWEELDKDDIYDEAALWGLTTSIVFRKSCKVPTGHVVNVPLPEDHPESIAAMQSGMPAPVKPIKLKKVHAEVVSPFNITFDGLAKRFQDVSIIMESSIRRLEYIKKVYGDTGPGYTGNADKVAAEMNLTNFLAVGESLKDIIEGTPATGVGPLRSGDEVKNSAILHECYIKPNEKFPRGRYIVIAGKELLYDSALDPKGGSPYFYLEGKVWHPYTVWQYHKIPGSIYGISLVQQLVPKQRLINSIDALVAYNRKSVGVGKWLIPVGSNIPDESITGKPGQNLSYQPGPRGEKPELISGVPLPMQVYEERAAHLGDMDRIANSADVRSGFNPKGVSTVGQLQILNENAQKSMSKPVDRWEKFIERSEQLDLLNFQSCYIMPDPQMIAKLKKLSKDLTSYDWQSFVGEQIQDNANVRVEKGSTISKSRYVMQQTLLSLVQAGVLPEVMMDPFAHKMFLEKFGVSDLVSDNNQDVAKAEKCIEMMLNGIYPPVDVFDNPDIQILVLTRFMKAPKFMDVDPKIKLLFKRRWDEYIGILAQANAVPPPDATGEDPNAPQEQPGQPGGKPKQIKAIGKASTEQAVGA